MTAVRTPHLQSATGEATPQVSVIIAAYNAADYLAEAVSSALASRDVSLEVIVVDDQSTDDTWLILEGFGERIRKVRQLKGGAYKARNLGARMARGEWIAFLDADDRWHSDKLATQLSVAAPEIGLVYTDCRNFGTLANAGARQSDSTTFAEGNVFEPLVLNNFIALSSVLIRRRAFEELGGFSEKHVGIQDWDFWLRFASAGGQVKLVRDALTEYRIHSKQMTQNLDQRAAERVAVLERALASPLGRQLPKSVARRARANVWLVGAWMASVNEPRLAIAWYLRAASYWPWNTDIYKGVVKGVLNPRLISGPWSTRSALIALTFLHR